MDRPSTGAKPGERSIAQIARSGKTQKQLAKASDRLRVLLLLRKRYFVALTAFPASLGPSFVGLLCGGLAG